MGKGFIYRLQLLPPLLVLVFLLAAGNVRSQLPVPVLNCISIEDDGSLTVNWSVPAGTFDGFRLFYKKISDPVSNSLDFNNMTGNTSLPVTDALTVGYEVYLITFNYGPPFEGSVESNHLRSMMLSVSNGGVGSGIAHLEWNRIQSGSNGVFLINRATSAAGPFTLIGQSDNTVYNDTITFPYCHTPTDLYYRVEFSSGSCIASSSIASGSFFDDNIPDDPQLSLVTIDAAGLAEISWSPSPSADADGYIIGIKAGAGWTDYYTVGNVTTFVDNLTASPGYHSPCEDVVTYTVRAVDQCGDNQSSGAVNYQFPHNTILLTGEATTLCNRKASLHWNSYNNMDPPVSSYRVYRSEGIGSPVEIASIDAGPASFDFVDPDLLTAGTLYAYQVAAVSSDASKISRSCLIPVTPDPELLTEFSLDYLTVADNDHIDLFLNGTPPDIIHEIQVKRSAVDGSAVESLFIVPWDGTSPVSIADTSARVNETSYFYNVTALDACGFEMETSAVSRSIYLQIEDAGNDLYRLSWNAYEDWGSSLIEYNIYRLADGVVEAGFPVSVNPSTLVYTDQAGNLEANRTTYYVEALRNDDVKSISNEVVLPADPVVLVPNAFRPDGISPQFKPLIKNIEPGSYLFTIYNRWGQLVFETRNIAEGWNGLFNGREAPQDVYAWSILYNNLAGTKTAKRGALILFR